MEIQISAGSDQMLLRGEQRNFELCSRINRRDKKSGRMAKEWVAVKWYSTLEGVFQSLLTMKLRACDATSLLELKQELENSRNELLGHWNTDFSQLANKSRAPHSKIIRRRR